MVREGEWTGRWQAYSVDLMVLGIVVRMRWEGKSEMEMEPMRYVVDVETL